MKNTTDEFVENILGLVDENEYRSSLEERKSEVKRVLSDRLSRLEAFRMQFQDEEDRIGLVHIQALSDMNQCSCYDCTIILFTKELRQGQKTIERINGQLESLNKIKSET